MQLKNDRKPSVPHPSLSWSTPTSTLAQKSIERQSSLARVVTFSLTHWQQRLFSASVPNGQKRAERLTLGVYVDDLSTLYSHHDEHSLYSNFIANGRCIGSAHASRRTRAARLHPRAASAHRHGRQTWPNGRAAESHDSRIPDV